MGKTLETRNRWVLDGIGVRDCKGEQKLLEKWSLKSHWWCLLPNRIHLSKFLEKCTIRLDLMNANCTSIKMGESLRDWSFLAVNTLVSSLLKTSVSKHLSCSGNACGILFSFPKKWKPSTLESNFSRSVVAQLTGNPACSWVPWASLVLPLLLFLSTTWAWWYLYHWAVD